MERSVLSYQKPGYPIDHKYDLKGDFQGEVDALFLDEEVPETVDKRWQLLCSNCAQVITGDSERIAVNGSHEHTFTNPHGIIFQIGCFANASGLVYIGEETEQWSWFKGYSWKIVSCSSCRGHLGWVFIDSGVLRFYGLILNLLKILN